METVRSLPSVDEVCRSELLRAAGEAAGRALLTDVARAELEERRKALLEGERAATGLDVIAQAVEERLQRVQGPSLRPVINATGVVLHTNLGRAPLAQAAAGAVKAIASGYSNLELDTESGERGSRQSHIEGSLRRLTGAEAALCVNNNAAAVLLAVTALANGKEVVISRGQLVEIGDSFRIPDVISAAGAKLVEVGSTNRTHASDYLEAIGPDTAAIMRVHPCNFRTVGFSESVAIDVLGEIAREHGIFLIDDLGSGALLENQLFDDEPGIETSLAWVDVVCFSADKLLGGPQGGILLGRSHAIERLRKDPVARAVRIDKLALAALEATLKLYQSPERAAREVPALRMLLIPAQEVKRRAESIAAVVEGRCSEDLCEVTVGPSAGRAGGGALPLTELESFVCAVRPKRIAARELALRLRRSKVAVVTRVKDGSVLLDPRTMSDSETEEAANGVVAALS